MAKKAAETVPKGKKWDAKLSHKLRHTAITIAVTLVIVVGGGGGYLYFKNDTQTAISNDAAKAVVSTIRAPDAARAHFNEAGFSMDLPSDWKRLQPDTSGVYAQYKYQSGMKNADNRYLSVYVDRLPLNMPVNKEVRLTAEGDKLSHGNISDNCAQFTTKPSPQTLTAPAKWDGADFICDLDGTARNIAGTGAPGAVNKVELTNADGAKHTFFFLYEDDNYNPDYGIFYDMLDSFTVK